MRKLWIFLALILGCHWGFAQAETTSANTGTNDNPERIAIGVVVPAQAEPMPGSSNTILTNKLNHILTRNGIGGDNPYERFILFPQINVMDKEIAGVAPTNYILSLEVLLFVGDGINGKTYGTEVVNLRGAGPSEEKAYINALRQLKPNKKIDRFLETAQQNILRFFEDNCEVYLQEAENFASQQKYEQALFLLSQVPSFSRDCYLEAGRRVEPIYKAYLEIQCAAYLERAKALWVSGKTQDALMVLSRILPNCSCYSEAQLWFAEIRQKAEEKEVLEYLERMKRYNDKIEMRKLIITLAAEVGIEGARAMASYWENRRQQSILQIIN
jgi:tetratricopeptide (TPR) repeat protein